VDNFSCGDQIINIDKVASIVAQYADSTFTALLWGHVCHYRLLLDRRLLLEPASCYASIERQPGGGTQMRFQDYSINEIISGDYWLVIKHYFDGPQAYIPAADGKVVTNKLT